MKPIWKLPVVQFYIQLISLLPFMQCVHIEDPYEHMNKYYQYGYQVDDHYTGEASVPFCPVQLHFHLTQVTTTGTWSTRRAT